MICSTWDDGDDEYDIDDEEDYPIVSKIYKQQKRMNKNGEYLLNVLHENSMIGIKENYIERSEIISKCRRQNKFLLINAASKEKHSSENIT